MPEGIVEKRVRGLSRNYVESISEEARISLLMQNASELANRFGLEGFRMYSAKLEQNGDTLEIVVRGRRRK